MFSVLLVEDDGHDARLVNELLAQIPSESGQCLKLAHASTLAQASSEIRGRAWDLVLLDLSLPDSSGLETLSAVQGLSQAPVVVLAGQGHPEAGQKAVEAGARGFLVKGDFDGDRLWKTISKAISGDLDERDPDAERPASPEESAARGRLLHVEDEPMIQELTRLLLESLGVEVTTAESGARALEILGEASRDLFDVLLIDMTMPGISGYSLVAAIQELGVEGQLVVTSGGELPARGGPAEELRFLPKPYLLKDLRELMAECLGPA